MGAVRRMLSEADREEISRGIVEGLEGKETALQVEMAEHLGYEHGDSSGYGSGNSRNGHDRKTVRTDIGDARIEVPRDRAGTFTPAVAGGAVCKSRW